MIRLVIADDHAIVRGGLKQLFALAPDVEVVGEAADGNEVLAIVRQDPPDLLLLDLNMPGITGADLIRRVKSHCPGLPVLILSMYNESQIAARMLRSGAAGYITKDSEPEVLLASVRKVAAGGRYVSQELAERLVFDVTGAAQAPAHELLSAREFDVFLLLAKGLTVNDIAAQLAISNKTVSTHKLRLMEKMQLGNMAELMRYALDQRLLS